MSKSTTSLQGKAALVTGAVIGIGKAIAAALAAEGAAVMVNHNQTPGPADKVVADINAAGGTAVAAAADISIRPVPGDARAATRRVRPVGHPGQQRLGRDHQAVWRDHRGRIRPQLCRQRQGRGLAG
jgi:NAD(P)-dependent dehydrogenase (short-subunit alcohol dehydrogenase family)